MNLTASTYNLLQELDDFSYSLSSSDRIWNILCPSGSNHWNHLRVSKYRETFYFFHINGSSGTLEIELNQDVRVLSGGRVPSSHGQNRDQAAAWKLLITSASDWLKVVRKDWIKANRRVREEYPLNDRYGIVLHAIIRASLPDIYRLDTELGKENTKEFLRLVEDGYFNQAEYTEIATMTAADYFNYCRIAYLGGKRDDEDVDISLSGMELYCQP